MHFTFHAIVLVYRISSCRSVIPKTWAKPNKPKQKHPNNTPTRDSAQHRYTYLQLDTATVFQLQQVEWKQSRVIHQCLPVSWTGESVAYFFVKTIFSWLLSGDPKLQCIHTLYTFDEAGGGGVDVLSCPVDPVESPGFFRIKFPYLPPPFPKLANSSGR